MRFFSSLSACCEKILVIEIVRTTYIRDYRKYQYSGNRGKKVVLYLLAKVYNVTTDVLSHTFRNRLIDSFEVFSLCTGSLTLCAQVHSK